MAIRCSTNLTLCLPAHRYQPYQHEIGDATRDSHATVWGLYRNGDCKMFLMCTSLRVQDHLPPVQEMSNATRELFFAARQGDSEGMIQAIADGADVHTQDVAQARWMLACVLCCA